MKNLFFFFLTVYSGIIFSCTTIVSVNLQDNNLDIWFGKNRDRRTCGSDGTPSKIPEGQTLSRFTDPETQLIVTGILTSQGKMVMGSNSAGFCAAINMAPFQNSFQCKTLNQYLKLKEQLEKESVLILKKNSKRIHCEIPLMSYSSAKDFYQDILSGKYRAHKIYTATDSKGYTVRAEFVTLSLKNSKKKSYFVIAKLHEPLKAYTLYSVNHFLYKPFEKLNKPQSNKDTSRPREQRVSNLLKDLSPLNLTKSKQILRDHYKSPYYSICSHRDLSEVPYSPNQVRSLASFIFHPDSKGNHHQSWFLIGSPCISEYFQITPDAPMIDFLNAESPFPVVTLARYAIQRYETAKNSILSNQDITLEIFRKSYWNFISREFFKKGVELHQ